MSSSLKIAVIGAGLAGIAAANRLKERGADVLVFEKSRGYGGRCASKRWEGQIIDHGAQFFSMRDESFRAAAFKACGTKLQALRAPILTFDGEEWRGGSRYYHTEGNSRLVRDLAAGLEVKTGVLIEEIKAEGAGWKIDGQIFDRVVSTAPLPQTRKLAGLEVGESEYVSCLALLLLYKGEKIGKSKNVYAYSNPEGDRLIWTACENHKDGRIKPGLTALVAHASAEFSEMYRDSDPEQWARKLRGSTEERWKISASAFQTQIVHTWRYARVLARVSAPALPERWFFAGDALTESRVEGAWLAGRTVADQMAL